MAALLCDRLELETNQMPKIYGHLWMNKYILLHSYSKILHNNYKQHELILQS